MSFALHHDQFIFLQLPPVDWRSCWKKLFQHGIIARFSLPLGTRF